jgi:hypothetical protein
MASAEDLVGGRGAVHEREGLLREYWPPEQAETSTLTSSSSLPVMQVAEEQTESSSSSSSTKLSSASTRSVSDSRGTLVV